MIKTVSLTPQLIPSLSEIEKKLKSITFNIHKFTPRPRPAPNQVVIFSLFSEFGSETLAPLYCLPQFLANRYQGKYAIVMGWKGREFLYRHLVDEYWETTDESQHLREYCKAFHHVSENLKNLEQRVKQFGKVVDGGGIGNILSFVKLDKCIIQFNKLECGGQLVQFEDHQECTKCGSRFDPPGLLTNVLEAKKKVRWLPNPSQEKREWVEKWLPANAVGITARNRKCYGRNLNKQFYEDLIDLIIKLGYSPVWLGEKVTTLKCPRDIPDFSILPEANDLETTLALVSQMKFTIQFWTASSRLSGFVGTPFIIFESPDQIFGQGHEGYRLNLTTKGNKKLVISHYKQVVKEPSVALNHVERVIKEIEENNFKIMIGQVNEDITTMIKDNWQRVGFSEDEILI